MDKIKDIFTGKTLNIWEDNELVYCSIFPNGVTICLDKEG